MKKSSDHSNTRNRRSSGHSSRGRNGTRSRGGAKVNPEWLKNFLTEMLAVERGGVQLYEKALEELSHDDLRRKLEQFHEQTQRHVELCEELLEEAGGDEGMSPGAEAAEHKAQGLMTAEVPEEMADINNLENLVLAETKDNWNWEMLGSLMQKIEDNDLKKSVSRAVREVRKQENDHLKWTQKALTQVAMEAAHESPEMEEDEEVEMEEEEAQDY
jgi:rubrerythrin